MSEHVDVLIVGAGLSGIGAAWRLRRQRPSDTYAIVEARGAIGGTWDLFRYPGVRSDSDMYTLSYPFRPWREPEALASGSQIRGYIEETAAEAGITGNIRFGQRVVRAEWSSADARWTVHTADRSIFTCDFLYCCSGYYSYASGHRPDFPGMSSFDGAIIHPQSWPADLSYAGKRVVVIGSGATAVTLVPAMAAEAAHVTMLQRSPTYVTPLPDRDAIADLARRFLPPKAANRVARAKNILLTQAFYQLARRRPALVRRALRGVALRYLNDPAYVDEHFKPTYQPWDQRLCVIPDGDLFQAIADGRASVVTDRVASFTATGIRLESGAELDADIVVTATGLELLPVGGIALTVDGEPIDVGQRSAYRGLMLSGVPNFAYCIGYTNASWTLRADLSHRYLIKLLDHLDRNGLAVATPTAPARSGRPLIDLSSGYVRRALDKFPRQGDRDPWIVRQNYLRDVVSTPRADVTRDMTFTPVSAVSAVPASRKVL
jgi:monooxygenase